MQNIEVVLVYIKTDVGSTEKYDEYIQYESNVLYLAECHCILNSDNTVTFNMTAPLLEFTKERFVLISKIYGRMAVL
jgi:hypothetical protein